MSSPGPREIRSGAGRCSWSSASDAMDPSDSGGRALSHPPGKDIRAVPDFRASARLVTAAIEYGSVLEQSSEAGRLKAMRMFQVCVCGQPLQCNEQPTPEPKGTEVLLKVLAAGVCHSDLHLADGWFDLGG